MTIAALPFSIVLPSGPDGPTGGALPGARR